MVDSTSSASKPVLPSRTIDPEELFDPVFLESVQRLRIIATRVARAGRPAEQRSRDMGSGIEFRDFRGYTPGDDFRAIDWNIYQRLGRVFIRLFEELEDLPVYLLPDLSESMFLEDPPRARAALRVSLALAAIALHQHDSVSLLPFGEELEVRVRATSGKNQVLRFAHHLAGLTREERRPGTDIRAALDKLRALPLRSGLVIIVSDFFDPAGLDAVLDSVRMLRHRVLLCQIARDSDRNPSLEGDVRVVDCETQQVEDVSITPSVIEAYRRAYDRFQDRLTAFARDRHLGFVRIDADRDVLAQLGPLFETGSLIV